MSKAVIIEMIITISSSLSFDPHLALAVAKTESNFTQTAVGPVGEIGLFQIRPEYSQFSEDELKQVETNIREGIRKLKKAAANCPHKDEMEWLVCYNVGVTGGGKIKHPRLFPYYRKVTENYSLMKEKYEVRNEQYDFSLDSATKFNWNVRLPASSTGFVVKR